MATVKAAAAYGWATATLGHTFANEALLIEALTHGGSGLKPTYERLEFLGDRVLGLAVADMLQAGYPEADEGELGRRHAALVQGITLTQIAEEWGLAAHMRTGTVKVPAGVLADGVEAVLGAVFLDAGWAAARAVVGRFWQGRLVALDGRDAKTTLQELLQGQKKPVPQYKVVGEQGPDHAKVFVVKVTCALGDAEGQGVSKNEASKQAAKNLLSQLESKVS